MADEHRDPFDDPDDPSASDPPPYRDQPPPEGQPPAFPPPGGSLPPSFPPPTSFPPPSSSPPPTSGIPEQFPPGGPAPGASVPPAEPYGYGGSTPPASPSGPGAAPPPGQYPPPAWTPGMPPAMAPQKKGRGCLFWAVLGFVLLILLVGGCGIVGYLLIRGPIDGTNEFLAEVADGDYAGAEALVAPDCTLSAAQIEADLAGLTDYQIFLASTGTGEIDRTGGTVTINGQLLDFTAQVRDTDDGWRVCSYTFDELQIGG